MGCSLINCVLTAMRNNTSLKNHGVEHEVNEMFKLGKAFMELPLDQKMQYEEGDDGMQFGFVVIFAQWNHECKNMTH